MKKSSFAGQFLLSPSITPMSIIQDKKSRNLSLAFMLVCGITFIPCFALAYTNNTTGNTVPVATTLEITDTYCYFGPNSTWNISGDLVIYSENVWIAPTAVFTGSGKIVFKDPSERTGLAVSNRVDGNNGNFIDVNIEMNNRYGIVLGDITDPEFLTTNPSGPLAAALNVGKNFNLTSLIGGNINLGDVFLNGNNFAFDPDAAISGYQPGRFVDTGNSIAGHMVKTFDATSDAFVFPVGFLSTNSYNPARIDATSGTFYVSLQDNDASASNESLLQDGAYISRTWHIYAHAPTPATVDLQHDAGNEDGGFDHGAPHIVTQWLGGVGWEHNPEAPGDFGTLTTVPPYMEGTLRSLSTTVQTAGSTYAYWTKAFLDNPALPVTLIKFNAEKEGFSTILSWATATEINSSSFEVQKSKDAKIWTGIGEVKASGESTSEKNYSFVDLNPFSGQNYYRLKMIDRALDNHDGKFAYSKINSLNFNQIEVTTDHYFYPNPAVNTIQITRAGQLSSEQVRSVELYTVTGILIYSTGKIVGSRIDVSRIGAGTYVMAIIYANGTILSDKILIGK